MGIALDRRTGVMNGHPRMSGLADYQTRIVTNRVVDTACGRDERTFNAAARCWQKKKCVQACIARRNLCALEHGQQREFEEISTDRNMHLTRT